MSNSILTGAQAFYTCSDGYKLIGNDSRTCQINGSWSGADPYCDIADCGPLSHPENGSVNYNTSFYLAVATYSCVSDNFLSGTVNRTCGATGDWSGEAPVCVSLDCTSVFSGLINETLFTQFNLSDLHCCDEGFRVSFNVDTSSGTVGSPLCEKVDCAPLYNISNSDVTYVRSSSSADYVIYTCQSGYLLNGTKERFCQSDGSWNGTIPDCYPVDCGTPPNAGLYPYTSFNSTTYGALAFYSCEVGFSISGTGVNYCNDSGLWESDAPICVVTGK